MTEDEAKKVGEIVMQADGGCPECVRDLVEQLNAAALGFKWTYTPWKYTNGQRVPETMAVEKAQEAQSDG